MNWLVFTMMMSVASGIGLGFLGAEEFVGRPPLVAHSTWDLPDSEPAAGSPSAVIQVAALPPPGTNPAKPGALPITRILVDSTLEPHGITAGVWPSADPRGLIHAGRLEVAPIAPQIAETVATASQTWPEHYDEALELLHVEPPDTLSPPANEPQFPGSGASPVIAIVIDDLGLNRRQTAAITALPGPLTLAFIPYAEDLARQTEAALDHGHEIFLHLPMEPLDPAKNPGPNALLSSLSSSDLSARLVANLDRFSGYVGVNNHMGSRLTQDAGAMMTVMGELKRRGLLFLDSLTIGGSVAQLTADKFGVPAAKRDIFLDNDPDVAAIFAQLTALEAVANQRGYAIAIGHPYGATVTALARWIPGAQARGYSIVPVSQIITARAIIVAQQMAQQVAPAAGP